MLSPSPFLECIKAEIYLQDCYYITLDIGKLAISHTQSFHIYRWNIVVLFHHCTQLQLHLYIQKQSPRKHFPQRDTNEYLCGYRYLKLNGCRIE